MLLRLRNNPTVVASIASGKLDDIETSTPCGGKFGHFFRYSPSLGHFVVVIVAIINTALLSGTIHFSEASISHFNTSHPFLLHESIHRAAVVVVPASRRGTCIWLRLSVTAQCPWCVFVTTRVCSTQFLSFKTTWYPAFTSYTSGTTTLHGSLLVVGAHT